MLTNDALHLEAAVPWSRSYSRQALTLQSSGTDVTETGLDVYRSVIDRSLNLLVIREGDVTTVFAAHSLL